ncbi:hypothetical protein [Alsobacter sp. SYSU BS001988]
MSALRDFATKALETNRIGFADLRRLQRDVLPQRVTTTDEAELLLAIDGDLVRADRDWNDYLVDAVTQFALWGIQPQGRVTQTKAAWLSAALAAARPKSATTILKDLYRQAPVIEPALHRRHRSAGQT